MLNKICNFLYKNSPVILLAPFRWAIGNCSEEIYYGLLKARRERKKVIFLYPEYSFFAEFRRVCNKEIFDIESPYCLFNDIKLNRFARFLYSLIVDFVHVSTFIYEKFIILLQQFVTNLHRVKYRKSKRDPSIHTLGRANLWKPETVDYFSFDIVNSFNWEEQLNEYLSVMLNKNKFHHSEQLRVAMGIPLDRWFVCLHVREASFHNDSKRFPFRNASILNYIKGIKAITDAGGFVVRMGDSNMAPLPSMEHVIDYLHTEFKSELMDLYLISECRFFIGTDSGIYDTARLFQKRTLLINASVWPFYHQRKYDITIMKHVFSKSRNKFLSIKERLEDPLDYQDWGQGKPDYIDYVIIENTPDEIYEVIVEFLSNPVNFEYSLLQNEFTCALKNKLIKGFTEKFFKEMLPDKIKVIEQYWIALHTVNYKGTMGKKYLEQNWLKDSMINV